VISPDFAILGAALPLAGFASYIRAVLAGRAQPDRVSWSLWAAAPLIAFAAEVSQHAGLRAALVTLTLGLGPLAVVLASLASPGTWKLTRLDLACGAASVLALELWAATRQGDVAIAFAILADGLAAVPTVTKSWSHPETETAGTYLASGAGAVVTLLTVRDWTFATCGFPVYVAAVCAVISALILVPPLASLPAGRRAAATALCRGGWAAATAASVAAVAVAVTGIVTALTAPAVVPPGLTPPPAAAALIPARPAYTTTAALRPGVRHHRRRRYGALSALPPGPGSPPPPTASPSPSRPSPQSPTPGPRPTSSSPAQPYPSSSPPDPPPTGTPASSPSPSPDPPPASPSPPPTPPARLALPVGDARAIAAPGPAGENRAGNPAAPSRRPGTAS
jgi:hypothetical protein